MVGDHPQLTLSLPIGYGPTPTEHVVAAVAAEEAGLDAIAVGELNSTDSMALIGAMAASTQRIRLETSVAAVWTRSSALYAMSAATLSDLSGGRFVLGLGAGSPMVAAFHGEHFAMPVAHVRRAVQEVRCALAGGTLPDDGGFRLRGVPTNNVPLFVSAMNDRMVALAGDLADGMVLNFCDPRGVTRLRGIALAAGAADRPFEVHAIVWLYAGVDEERGRASFRRELAPYLAVPAYQRAAIALSDEDAVHRAADIWRKSGRDAAAAAFPESIVDALVVFGSPEDVARRVLAFEAAGCQGLRFTPIADDPTAGRGTLDVIDILSDTATVLRSGSVKRDDIKAVSRTDPKNL
jgi:alkanesulfonate monooxygenase SsuD/methylene tetrahydromethanopterin reductase-like flavin-dependent oxidoreductase (luciferase family)